MWLRASQQRALPEEKHGMVEWPGFVQGQPQPRLPRAFAEFLCLLSTATLGAVFGLTTCLSAQVREEPESPLDYFIGGCTTGALIGARGKCGWCLEWATERACSVVLNLS